MSKFMSRLGEGCSRCESNQWRRRRCWKLPDLRSVDVLRRQLQEAAIGGDGTLVVTGLLRRLAELVLDGHIAGCQLGELLERRLGALLSALVARERGLGLLLCLH